MQVNFDAFWFSDNFNRESVLAGLTEAKFPPPHFLKFAVLNRPTEKKDINFFWGIVQEEDNRSFLSTATTEGLAPFVNAWCLLNS